MFAQNWLVQQKLTGLGLLDQWSFPGEHIDVLYHTPHSGDLKSRDTSKNVWYCVYIVLRMRTGGSLVGDEAVPHAAAVEYRHGERRGGRRHRGLLLQAQ